MNKLENKIVLITGATSGIGAATAKLFLEEGATVICVARKIPEKQENQVIKNNALIYKTCDITKKEEINNLYDFVNRNFGRLDVLFNNAGTLRTGSLEEITDEDWDFTYETNLKSVLHMCQTFIKLLQKSNGVILNNASINGLHSYIKGKRSYMYATSKSALIQLTKYLAKNYAPNIRVNCLCPGMTVTNLFTNKDFSRFNDVNLMGRMAEPVEIAKVALFLCSSDSSFVTGAVIIADGGETIK